MANAMEKTTEVHSATRLSCIDITDESPHAARYMIQVMRNMNQSMDQQKMAKTMMEFQKQQEMMQMKFDMMDDALIDEVHDNLPSPSRVTKREAGNTELTDTTFAPIS